MGMGMGMVNVLPNPPVRLLAPRRALLRDCCALTCRSCTRPSFHSSLHHSRLADADAFASNFLQNASDISIKSSNGCSRIKRKMGLLPTAFLGVFLSFLLLGRFHNDAASAEIAALGLDFVSEHKEQMEPRKGNCATCLGVVDETLGACGGASNCVSSFDDRPSFFMAPWEFPGKLSTAFEQINRILVAEGGNVVEKGNRYIHAVFTGKDGTIDDVEFLFSIPSEDATVNIRSASRKISQNDYGRNRKRLDKIRQTLTWEEVPVLRNRSRALFFLESPWDTFGPEPPPAFDYKDKLEYVPD